MSHPLLKKIFNILEKLRWYFLAVAGAILILFVVMMGMLRLALPYLSDYRDDIEQILSRELQRDIQVKQIDADWHWFSPRLKLIDVSISEKESKARFLRLDEVSFEFGLIGNLVDLSFEPTVITLSGGTVKLKKDKAGQLFLQSRPLAKASKGNVNSDDLLNEIAAQLNNKEVHVHDMEVQWTDLSHSRAALVIDKVNAIVKVRDTKFQVLVDAKTPDQIAKTLMIKADIRRDQKPADREINIYVHADHIRSDYVYRYITDPGVRVNTVVDTEAWLRIKGSDVQEISGLIATDQIDVFSRKHKKKNQWSAKKLSAKFKLKHEGDVWSLTFDKLNMNLGHNKWRDVYLTSRINLSTNAVRLRCDTLYLEDVAELVKQLPVGKKIKKIVSTYKPFGVLKKTNIVINDWEQTNDWIFKTRFDGLGVSLETGNMKISGLSGSLVLEEDSGRLLLDSKNAGFKSEYFNRPVHLDSLKTEIRITSVNKVRQFQTEKLAAIINGVKVGARLKYVADNNRHLDLQLSAKRFSANWFKKHQSDYFLGKETSDWIATAVRDASLEDISLVVHGSLNDLPFRNNTGVLQAGFKIKNGVLKFAENWPEVKNLNGHFSYDNDLIKITESSGRIFSSTISNTVTTIDLNKSPHVIVEGKVLTNADELGRFFKATPLAPDYSSLTKSVNIKADISSDLRVDVPLNDDPVIVSGNADVTEGVLTVDSPRYVVTDLKGDVRFKGTDIFSNKLTGQFDGKPVIADINTHAFKNTRQTEINARFTSGLSELLPFDVNLDAVYQNNADWLMRLGLLHDDIPGEAGIKVSVSSNLDGMALLLPMPLYKAADEKVEIRADYSIFSDSSELMVHCNSKINLNMSWTDGFERLRSDIRIQDGPVLALKPGINISAKADEIDLAQWNKLLQTFKDDKSVHGDINLNKLVLQTPRLQYEGYQLKNVNLQTKPDAVKLILDIASDEFTGEVEIYPSFSLDKPVEVNFSKMKLSSLLQEASENEEKSVKEDDTISPLVIPPLKISGKDFTYKDFHFDEINLETSRSRYGMTIHALDLKSDFISVKAKGNWFIQQNKHQSSFRIELASENAGGMLSAYNLTKSMKNGNGQAVVNWQWPAAPFDFDWKLVSGTMRLDLADGRFVDIEPGAGRLLGMFSLSSLPKRFMLDFSDTFSEGFEYSELSSQANFIDGSLYTNKTAISGSSADIYFNGRIGLADKDYDQIMSVVPRISSGVSGWIAVLQGAAVGLTAYLGQKLLGVDEAAKNQYHITGTWKDPVIKKLGEDKKQPEEDAIESDGESE